MKLARKESASATRAFSVQPSYVATETTNGEEFET